MEIAIKIKHSDVRAELEALMKASKEAKNLREQGFLITNYVIHPDIYAIIIEQIGVDLTYMFRNVIIQTNPEITKEEIRLTYEAKP